MKKAEIFFKPIAGSAPLSVYWVKGQMGDATEANNEIGVGFFSEDGKLLGAMFDDVSEASDNQTLEFDSYKVSVKVENGKVKIDLIEL